MGGFVRDVSGGDLDMFSSKIASLNGGEITIQAGGSVNVGSRDFSAGDAAARGIFTVDRSDVTVVARGDIIASADGVVQVPLNGVGTTAGTVTLMLGERMRQGGNLSEAQVVLAAALSI